MRGYALRKLFYESKCLTVFKSIFLNYDQYHIIKLILNRFITEYEGEIFITIIDIAVNPKITQNVHVMVTSTV